jgi:hypothetical protein
MRSNSSTKFNEFTPRLKEIRNGDLDMCLNHLHEITYEIVCEDEDDVWRQSCGC